MKLCNNQTMDACIPCESLTVLKSQSALSVESGCCIGAVAGPLWPQALPDGATMGKSQDKMVAHESGALRPCNRLVLTPSFAMSPGQELPPTFPALAPALARHVVTV